MKRRNAITAVATFVAGVRANASIPFPIPLKELYGASKTVAVVEIVEGRVVSAGGEPCGARYTCRVVEGIKGAKPSVLIEFEFLPSLKLGTSYLLFLGGYEGVYIPGAPDFLSRCKSVLPQATTTAHWRGAMEIVGDTSTPKQRDAWTVRPVKHVTFPLGTRTTIVDGEKQLWFADLAQRMVDEK
ncbi:MAG: hypothetical protein C0428_05620 [Polaromonas sp.]|nr:hypothetical protein [Polaromonas sp.]